MIRHTLTAWVNGVGETGRRSFLVSLGTAVATIALGPRVALGRPSAHLRRLSRTDASALSDLELDRYINAPPLLDGFHLVHGKNHGNFGFSNTNGHQAVFTFTRPTPGMHAHPLRVVIAHEPAGPHWRTHERTPEYIRITGESGRVVTGHYFDGFWAARHKPREAPIEHDGWDRTRVHSLVARTDRVAIAVQASRELGLDCQDLVVVVRAMV
jgi:hypothetical protein